MINLYDFSKGTNANEISGKLRAHAIMKTETFSVDETDKFSIDPFPSVYAIGKLSASSDERRVLCLQDIVSHIFRTCL